ncbi:MAG: hypothetical protein ACJAQT_002412 [Akkermansiaceae bacterium]
MAKGSQKSSKKKAVETRDLSNWKILRKFRQRLATAQAQRDEISGPSPREADPKRKLLEEDDFSFMLFGLLKEVFLQLASETTHSWGDPRLACMADQLTLIDGSLIPALPPMHWALWQIATTDLSMDFSMNSAR